MLYWKPIRHGPSSISRMVSLAPAPVGVCRIDWDDASITVGAVAYPEDVFSTPRGRSRSPSGAVVPSHFLWRFHHGTCPHRLLHHGLGYQPSGRPGARPRLEAQDHRLWEFPQARDLSIERFPACGGCHRPTSSRTTSAGSVSTTPPGVTTIIIVILSRCVLSGIVISRPIVRAMGLR